MNPKNHFFVILSKNHFFGGLRRHFFPHGGLWHCNSIWRCSSSGVFQDPMQTGHKHPLSLAERRALSKSFLCCSISRLDLSTAPSSSVVFRVYSDKAARVVVSSDSNCAFTAVNPSFFAFDRLCAACSACSNSENFSLFQALFPKLVYGALGL